MGLTISVALLYLMPMALKLGTGSEQYAPLARAVIAGLAASVLLTVYIVPAAYVVVYGRRRNEP
jgi:hydrophobic/amphiphilic exporter-1 (mainly G- bacteria), HAE1 family